MSHGMAKKKNTVRRMKMAAKDGNRDTIRRNVQGLDQEPSWDAVRSSQIPHIF